MAVRKAVPSTQGVGDLLPSPRNDRAAETHRCFSRTVQPHQCVLQSGRNAEQKINSQGVGAMERLNIARLLFSLKKTGKQKQNRGSVFICGPCQRGCTYIFLALRTYFCHSSCAAQWWGRWGWRMNLQVSHGWGSAEGKCPGMSLDPKMCLNMGIKPPEQWLENCTIQPIYGHELCFFARFGMSTSLTPGNAFLSSKSLFWLDGLSFPFCLSVLPTNTLFSWDWGGEGFSKGWNTDFIIIFIITFLLYHLAASWEML